ncbi:Rho GTPase activation protein [Blakeslea trispora]|nr:Rho GTPase activation protein [Blakeslea trispora]
MESLQMEMNIARTSYNTTSNLDSAKDIQLFDMYYYSHGFVHPSPMRYENYYMEGKCKEVLFGGLLESYALEHNIAVPKIVSICIEAVERMGGLQKEGIYRVSGRQSNIEALKHQFELDEDKVQLDSFDVFTIATVLKMYVRELKQPLFNFSIQTRANYSRTMPQNQRFALLESKLADLSLAHRSTLHCIFRHLSKINANSHVNKMNISNLALIFTPVIFHDFNQTEEGSISGDWSPEDLFEDLILYCDTLFPLAEETARRNNEQKLNEALNGKNPYTQFSQSNLLYLSNSALNYTHPTNLLLTQPMNPPHVSGAESPAISSEPIYDQPYPPKLTTIIGTVPPQQNSAPANHYRAPFRPTAPPQQQAYPSSDKMLPSIQSSKDIQLPKRPLSEMLPSNPSTSSITRGSSMAHHRQNSIPEPDYNNSPVPGRKPLVSELPRRGSSTTHLIQPKNPRNESLKGLDALPNLKPSINDDGPTFSSQFSQYQIGTEESANVSSPIKKGTL